MPSEVDRTMPLAPSEPSGPLIAGRYRLRALLGRGGTGEVYEAEDTHTGEPRAIKKLAAGAEDPVRRAERFRREARAGGLVRHPNIVDVIDLIGEHDALYLVMELVRGRPVSALIEQGELTARRTLVLARQVLEALAHAHARGLIHRDIKPDNLMVVTIGEPGREHERAKLLDLGLVKWIGDAAGELADQRLTQTGAVFGTPAYMAPEQALGRLLDERVDLYALGVVVFEMLTGRPPFHSPDPPTLLRMHASAPPPRLSAIAPGQPWCTPAVEELVARALAKQPSARFASALEMIDALDAAFVSIDHIPGHLPAGS